MFREQPSWTTSGVTIECRSENHVPVVVVSEQRGIPAYSDATGNSLPDWLQPFTQPFAEGFIDEAPVDDVISTETALAPDDAGCNSEQESEPETPQSSGSRIRPNECKVTSLKIRTVKHTR